MVMTLRRRLVEYATAYAFLAPFLVIWGIFVPFAVGYALYLSFTNFNLFSPPEWVGLKNYVFVLQNKDFVSYAVPNTLKYVAVVVPVQTVLALIVAFALDQKIRGRNFFRTFFYVPSVTSSVVISIIFIWLFARTGVINQLLAMLRLPSDTNWLTNTTTALPTIMMVNIWSTIGTLMLIFLAGLQDIPHELYEQAMIDGATRPQIFRHITVPLLRPVIFFVVTVGLIGCFQVFDQIYVMTQGGPLNSTLTIAYLVYKWAFQAVSPHMGRAAAVAFILAAMIFIVTMVQRRFLETE